MNLPRDKAGRAGGGSGARPAEAVQREVWVQFEFVREHDDGGVPRRISSLVVRMNVPGDTAGTAGARARAGGGAGAVQREVWVRLDLSSVCPGASPPPKQDAYESDVYQLFSSDGRAAAVACIPTVVD